MCKSKNYIPNFIPLFAPLYDPLVKWGIPEDDIKQRIIKRAHIKTRMRILDIGCGVGSLTIQIKQMYPKADVIGLECDPGVIEIARLTAEQKGVQITLDLGMAFHLPYLDHSFDRVFSSLVFHHLTTENRKSAMHEIYRVIRPGGELLIVDIGKPCNGNGSLTSRFLHGLKEGDDNKNGLLPTMMRDAGFSKVKVICEYDTIFGGLSLYRGN